MACLKLHAGLGHLEGIGKEASSTGGRPSDEKLHWLRESRGSDVERLSFGFVKIADFAILAHWRRTVKYRYSIGNYYRASSRPKVQKHNLQSGLCLVMRSDGEERMGHYS